MRGYATVSLTSLGTFLKMEDLLISPHVNDMEDFYDRTACQIDVDEEEDVQFLINSGVTVGGIKNRLQVSNFFQAMFRGGFKESTSDKVTLADVEAPVLRVGYIVSVKSSSAILLSFSFFFIGYFTYRIWLWHWLRCYTKFKPSSD
jgi:hypothetical protein